MLWSHIPCLILVEGTSNRPEKDIGNSLGPYIMCEPGYRTGQVLETP